MNALFVCSRNQWRSPTAERVWRNEPGFQVRSGGTSPNARHTVTAGDIEWADVIFAMEKKHRSRLRADFAEFLDGKTIHVLNIPDQYQFMDPELVDILRDAVRAALQLVE